MHHDGTVRLPRYLTGFDGELMSSVLNGFANSVQKTALKCKSGAETLSAPGYRTTICPQELI
jgi:hypothetical protein